MKYIGKTITVESSTDTYEGSDLKRFEGQEETRHFHLFNAILWHLNKHNNGYKGVRVFQPTKDISEAIKLDYGESCEDIEWYRVSLQIWGEKYTIHEIEDYAFPVPDFLRFSFDLPQ